MTGAGLPRKGSDPAPQAAPGAPEAAPGAPAGAPGAPADAAAAEAVERYLAQVARWLPGPARARRDVLDELRDGLMEVLDRHQPAAAGLPRPAAGEPPAALLARELGDPTVVGAAYARELRIRLARRCALQVLVLFVAAGLGWQVYDTVVGVPAAIAPTGAAGSVFHAGIDLLRICGPVAQAGAALLAVAVSSRWLSGVSWLPGLLAKVTLGATAGFGAGTLLMLVTAAPGYHGYLALVGAPVVAVTLLAAARAYQALRQLAAAA